MSITIDLRELDEPQRDFLYDRVNEVEFQYYFTVLDADTASITIEQQCHHRVAMLMLTLETWGTRNSVAMLLDNWCHRRPDLFPSNADHTWWWARVRTCRASP